MYYEEKLIDGVWQWRGTPDGEWRTMGVATLTRMLAEAHERERELRDVLRSLEWIEGEYGAKTCYNCYKQEWQGHTEPCLVAAVLAAAQPASDGQEGK